MLRKIYKELVAIRKVLQMEKNNISFSIEDINTKRDPYQVARTEWRRFELLTSDESEKKRLEKLIAEKNLSRQDLAVILFGLRVLPGYGKEDFDI